MSNPTPGDVHLNRPLTNVMIAWSARAGRYAFNTTFPIVPVKSQSDSFFVWDRADIFRDEAGEMGPGDRAPVTVARLSDDSYSCKVFGLAERIPDQVRANADAPLNLDRSATRRTADKCMLKMEKRWTQRFFTTGIWTGSSTGTDLVGAADFTKFASPSTGSPVTVIRNEIKELVKLGVNPQDMTLTIGYEVFSVFLDHDDFLTRYENTQAAILNEQLMAAVLGIKQVVVPLSVENTAAELLAPTNNFVHGDAMLLSFAPAAPSIDEPSAGYTFAWTGLTGSSNSGMRTLRMRDQFAHSDHIECQVALDPKATASELGVFFSDCL